MGRSLVILVLGLAAALTLFVLSGGEGTVPAADEEVSSAAVEFSEQKEGDDTGTEEEEGSRTSGSSVGWVIVALAAVALAGIVGFGALRIRERQ